MKQYLISLGYPIGIIKKEDNYIGMIDLNTETIVLNFIEYSIWNMIFKYGVKEELIEQSHSIFKQIDVSNILEILKEKHLLIEINDEENLEIYFEKIKNYKLHRQGFGIGICGEIENSYKVAIEKSEILLDSLQYTIWSTSNNKMNIEDMYNIMKEQVIKDISLFMVIILDLYQKNMIYFVR